MWGRGGVTLSLLRIELGFTTGFLTADSTRQLKSYSSFTMHDFAGMGREDEPGSRAGPACFCQCDPLRHQPANQLSEASLLQGYTSESRLS